MNFSQTYQRLNEPIVPSPALIEATLAKTRRRGFPLRRLAAIAAAAAVLLATPALAAQTEPGYQLLYAVSPAAAQFFQPVRQSCTDSGVTMEVAAVRIQGNTAEAYITLSGETVDGGCDLFHSYDFHLPFGRIGTCEPVGYNEETHTAAFLCTTWTTDGFPIPTGGKMTFSVDCFLSGKTALRDVEVPLNLTNCAGRAMAPDGDGFTFTGGGISDDRSEELLHSTRVLVPRPALAVPAEGLAITAAGYVDGLFHIQLCQGDASRLGSDGWLWLTDGAGKTLEPLYVAYFSSGLDTQDRQDYRDFVFEISRETLAECALRGSFTAFASRTDGNWRVTFPLRDTFSDAELAKVAGGHSTGSFDPQDTLLTFASQLEAESGRSVRWEDGFRYELLLKTDRLWAAEFQCPGGVTLRIYLQNIPYEETTGLWQPYAWAWQD